MHKPAISVIVPSYNKVEYLQECLESIREQTFEDWECIVVNDGSPRADDIVTTVLSMQDPRFRVVHHEDNRGLAAARNTGVRASSAGVIICVDEDDKLGPNLLEEGLNLLFKENADVVCTEVQFFGDRAGVYGCRIPTLREILHSQPLIGCGFLFRRELWQALGGWDEHPILKLGREDQDWWIRVLSLGAKIYLLPKPLYYYRVITTGNARSKSLNMSARLAEVRIRKYIMRKYLLLYGQHPMEKRIYLKMALQVESKAALEARLYGTALMRSLQALCFGFRYAELKRVLVSLCGLVGGESLIRALGRTKNTVALLARHFL